MYGINPKIVEKIKELVGDNGPVELEEFFNEVLKLEAKQETQQYGQKDISLQYKSILDKYSQKKSILDFIRGDKN